MRKVLPVDSLVRKGGARAGRKASDPGAFPGLAGLKALDGRLRAHEQSPADAGAALERFFWELDRALSRVVPWVIAAAAAYFAGHLIWALPRP